MAFVTYYEPFNFPYLDAIFSKALIKSKRVLKEDLLETKCDLMLLNEPFNLSILKNLPSYILTLTSITLNKKYYSCMFMWKDEFHDQERFVRLYSLTNLHLTFNLKQKKQTLSQRFKDCPAPTEFITICDLSTKKGHLYGNHGSTVYQVFELAHDCQVVYKSTPVVLYNLAKNLFWCIRSCEILALKGYTLNLEDSKVDFEALEHLPSLPFLTSLVDQLFKSPKTILKTEVCIPSEFLNERLMTNLLQHITETYLHVCFNETVGFISQILCLLHVHSIYFCKADSTNRCQVEFETHALKVSLYRFYLGTMKFCVSDIGMVIDVPEFSQHGFKCQFLIKADKATFDPIIRTYTYPCGCKFEVGTKVKFEPEIIEYDNLKKVFNCQGCHVCH